jgi:hypothetical protein
VPTPTEQVETAKKVWRLPRVFILSWVLFALISAAWSIATPLGASPDEPAHLIKAASVARGKFIGTPTPIGEVVRVPAYAADELTCFAFHADITAACAKPMAGDPGRLVNAATTAGFYNPVYYLLVGWPSLIAHGTGGIFAMRIVSGILVSLFLALSLTLIARWRRPALPLIGFAAAVTPMTLFLAGTVNPNSLEIAATLTAFVGVLTIAREQASTRFAAVSAIVFVSASIAANMRGLSLLWLAFALFSPFVLVSRRRIAELLNVRAVRRAIAGTAVAAVFAAIWLVATNSLGASVAGLGSATQSVSAVPGTGSSPANGFVWTLSETLDYAHGIVGSFGWLDTPAPNLVDFIWSLLAGGLLLFGLILFRRRSMLLAAILLAAVLLLPAVLQAIYIHAGGVIWQGRYILPLFVCLMVALGSGLGQRIRLPRPVQAKLVSVVLVLWGVAQVASFATVLKRYAIGLNSGWLTILHPEWSPPGGVIVSLVTFTMIIAAAVVGLLLWLRRHHATGPATPSLEF